MVQELVWGKAGTPHIDGNDFGTINLALRGVGNYVLDYKDNLKATVESANSITIGTGVVSFEGRDIIISAAESVTIDSGSQGMQRNDIICEHYHRDSSSGVETVELTVIKGTPASSNPKDPTIPSGTILGGATDAYMPLYRIPLDGITVGTPVKLFKTLTTVDDINTTLYQSMSFDRSGLDTVGDDLAIGGHILNQDNGDHLAIVTLRWQNKGIFTTKSFVQTKITKMVGWKATREAMSPCMENIQYDALGKSAIVANDAYISYVTAGALTIPANSWHNGCLVFPVIPA